MRNAITMENLYDYKLQYSLRLLIPDIGLFPRCMFSIG